PMNPAPLAVCPIHSQRYQLELPRLEQARLLMAWVGPGSESLGTTYGLDLLATVLTGGRLSRLVHSLRETLGWVMDVDCHYALLQNAGLFTLSAWLDPEALEPVENHIRQAIIQLAQEPISPDELARVQRLMTNSYTFALETPSQLASLYGYYDHLGHLDQAVAYPQSIAGLEADFLQQVAATYLNPDHSLVTTVIPV
ncbi:MAG: insulinase family protein, partial [Gloeomargaritaceae cyanobacterium C42_A2020_066]|nr:insulinase family protein [Gloeomargaritaceae cyanobacterium C42_A2020_066]